jgi:hypothetical protein
VLKGATNAVAEERSCGSHLGYVNGVAIAPDTIVRRAPDVITEPVLDDVVVLDPASGRYVKLNASAAALWGELDGTSTSVGSLARVLEERLAAPSERAQADAQAFVEALSARGLIELSAPS